MNQDLILKTYFVTYFGVYGLFMTAYLTVIVDSEFYLSLLSSVEVAGALAFFAVLTLWNLRKLRQNGFKIRVDRQHLRSTRLLSMLVGFILMVAGISVSAISKPVSMPVGTQEGLLFHPFEFQGWALFFVGIGIQLIQLVWYYVSAAHRDTTVEVPIAN